MAEITTELVKQLRDATSVSIMQCKKALEEANGDMELALVILKKKSAEIAAKKSDREALAGILVARKNDTRAVVVEINCETDFVAKNDDFINLANTLAEMALSEGVEKTKENAQGLIDEVIQKVGENIKLGQLEEINGTALGMYVHDGRIATLVSLSGSDSTLAKDLAMHIAAMNPEYKDKTEVPEDVLANIRTLAQKEVDESDKPEEIKAKMLDGKVDGFLKERILMDQPFFKDSSKSVAQVLGSTTIEKYVRLSIG
jgi:elongation factor Ts